MKVYGSDDYVGGLFGYSGFINNSSVTDSHIESTGNYVGGLVGSSGQHITYNQIINSEIICKGNNVGGMVGSLAGTAYLQHSLVQNVLIEGERNVGGIVGNISEAEVRHCMINANIYAYSDTAGGIVGYMQNKNMTASTSRIYIYNNNVANSSITAPTKVGGIIGNVDKELFTTDTAQYYYNNYVHAYLSSEDVEKVSMGVGGLKEDNPKLENTYIYKYSTINEDYINEGIDTFKETQYLNSDDLKLETTYKNIIGWGSFFTYTSLKDNKYPFVNGIDNQEGIDLPEDPIDAETMQANIQQIAENIENKIPLIINSLITENGATEQTNSEQNNNIVTTPTYEIYPITANEINIDLNNIPEGTYLRIGQGENAVDIEIDSRTYTFKYDFKTPQTLQLIQKSTNNASLNTTSNQTESTAKQTTSTGATNTNTETILAEIKIEPEEIRNSTSLEGETNAILKGTEMYINGEKIDGGFVNIYKGKALTENGEIYDIESQEKDQAENKVEGLMLESKVKPREEYEYSGNTIKVYGKYSTINGQAKNQIYTVKSGKLSIISGKTELKIGNQVIDMINDREYETILLENGTIQDLKQSLKYPENFENSNIKEIVQNSDTERPEVLVYYNNGTVIVFNYLTGDIIYQQEIKQNIGLVDYIKQSLANIIPSSTNKTSKEYEESKELVEKLEEVPVEEALQEVKPNNGTNTQNSETNISTEETIQSNSTNTNNSPAGGSSSGTSNNGNSLTSSKNYVTSYNPETGSYEIYSVEEIINNSEEEPESETQKIQSNGLQQFYESYNTTGKKTKIEPGLVIIITTITAIGILSIAIIRRAKYAK